MHQIDNEVLLEKLKRLSDEDFFELIACAIHIVYKTEDYPSSESYRLTKVVSEDKETFGRFKQLIKNEPFKSRLCKSEHFRNRNLDDSVLKFNNFLNCP